MYSAFTIIVHFSAADSDPESAKYIPALDYSNITYVVQPFRLLHKVNHNSYPQAILWVSNY